MVVIEKTFPYNIGIYDLSTEFLDHGYEIQEQALYKVSEAVTSGIWSGYTEKFKDHIQTLDKPHWLGYSND